MDGASRGEYEGIVKVEDACAVAKQERAHLLLLWCGRAIVQDNCAWHQAAKGRCGGVVRIDLDGAAQ